MRKMFFLAALLIPITANAGSIDLEPNIYWQVQRASDYETLCEGFITECEVEEGIYNLINLSSGSRQNGVLVAPGGKPGNQSNTGKLEIVRNDCNWRSAVPRSTEPGNPDALLSYGNLNCEASCPAGKIVVGTIQCSLETDNYGSDFLIPVYLPTVLHLRASENSVGCSATTDVVDGDQPFVSTVIISCQ